MGGPLHGEWREAFIASCSHNGQSKTSYGRFDIAYVHPDQPLSRLSIIAEEGTDAEPSEEGLLLGSLKQPSGGV